ncbi:MAG TPA: GNAT family N-acetyltransferase [Actinocrinis sp.]|jgi:ribosomal protein S18 acetylase RimI-like enzyme
MDVLVREARENELDEVGELTAGVYAREDMADEIYLAVLRDSRARWAAPETTLLVALDDGTEGVIGTVTYAAPGSPWQDLAEPGEAEFRMLAVHESARGRGVGETLVLACVDRAKRAGLARLVLSTGPASQAAHRIYERLGFTRAPQRDWRPRGDDGVLLAAYVLTLR